MQARTGGIDFFLAGLRVVPDSRIDDKIKLPPSAFEALNAQNVFDVSASGVLTFEVCISGAPPQPQPASSSNADPDGDAAMGSA